MVYGIWYKPLVHRLVATAFIPNPENKPQVNHIDANGLNNKLENLEWVTVHENVRHTINIGNQITGINHKNSKHTENQIWDACKLLESNDATLSEISKTTGVSIKTLKNIKYRNGWNYISKDFNISSDILPRGPRFSNISKRMLEMMKENKSNNEIRRELKNSRVGSTLSKKSISDRLYHMRKNHNV